MVLGKMEEQVRAECAGDPRCKMDLIRDTVELGDKLLYAIFPSTVGFEVNGSIGVDAMVGGDASPFGLQFVWNWRSGEFAILRTGSAALKAGTPNLVSVNGRAGLILSWGASNVENYVGASTFGGGDLAIDVVGRIGGYLQNSTSVIPGTDTPHTDPSTGMQIHTLAIGGQAGANVFPNGVDGSLWGGRGYSAVIVMCTYLTVFPMK
jgi:hypothetical protein